MLLYKSMLDFKNLKFSYNDCCTSILHYEAYFYAIEFYYTYYIYENVSKIHLYLI